MCVGLICSCAEFFSEQFRFLSFDQWRWVLTAWSFLISILGLNLILQISSPVLSIIYPVTIAIILLNLLPGTLWKRTAVQRITVILALAIGIASVL